MAQDYVCRYCGTKTSSQGSGHCSYSPHKSHEWTEAKREYVCSYCGTKRSSPNGDYCSSSPHKSHKWI